MSAPPLQVVAGVLRDAHGRVLLAERPPGRHLAGLWEFPGGKIEPGELPVDALARELREEVGLVVESARPLISVPHRYPDLQLVLHAWQVTAWSGRPRAHEGQRLAWLDPAALDPAHMPAADHPVIGALRLPDRFLITPALPPGEADVLMHGIERACRMGVGMLGLRLPGWPRERQADIARAVRDLCRVHATVVLLESDWQLAAILGLDGVYLPAAPAATLLQRPLPHGKLVGVACADASALAHAAAIGADFAVLAPLFADPGAGQSAALGWEGFEALVARASLPVYAGGGLEADDIDAARMAGAQGVAATRGLWPGTLPA
ncbi:Nudix family hydrolase [Dokdonella sp.]|uniref:Nudix family hydrolase n=1 Tax=Dokdonella sp. TaxID=2291710 RepID=UPI0031CAE394|nr:Nudix family hydrolase [Dokdonella sp.]